MLAASGRVLFGLMADRVGAPLAGFVSFGFTILGLACLLGLEVSAVALLAYGYVLFLFLPDGLARHDRRRCSSGGSRRRPTTVSSSGSLGIGNSLGSALGPLLAGALHDWTGSYLVIYLSAIASPAWPSPPWRCSASRPGA